MVSDGRRLTDFSPDVEFRRLQGTVSPSPSTSKPPSIQPTVFFASAPSAPPSALVVNTTNTTFSSSTEVVVNRSPEQCEIDNCQNEVEEAATDVATDISKELGGDGNVGTTAPTEMPSDMPSSSI